MRRHRFLWLALGVAAVVGGVGLALHLHDGGPAAKHRNPLSQGSSRLVVYQTQTGGPMYTEGAQSYLTVAAGTGGSTTVGYQVMNPVHPVFSRRIAPGRYTITSWQRPCDGSCMNLDPATDRCRSTITMLPNRPMFVSIVLTPGHGCRILPRAHG